jgi:hemolysin activation/secretion protein
VISKVELSPKFLENYLEIKKNDIYSKKKVKNIKDKISNLSFIELKKSPKIVFIGSEASVLLALKSRKVNRFDFIVGLLSDKTGLSKFKLTGEIKSELINRLGKGERLYFKYKNLSKGKQNLNLEINYPYVMDLPFGLDSKFSIYINEKSYRDVKMDLGVQYLFKGMNYLKTYWSLFSSRLISIDSTTIFGTLRLPDKLDVQTNSVGINLNYSTLDYRFNAKRGFNMVLDGNIGQRNILKNQQIVKLVNENIDFENSYDSLKLTSYQFNLFANFSYYISLNRNIVFKIGNDISWKKSEVKLYQNELYKIGGNKILRGFDEESILGDLYNVTTAEMRLLIDKNSFLFIFVDYAFVHNPFQATNIWDQPHGFGAGINFDTKGGIIKLSTAVGSQQGNPIDFKDVKIHLGYVSLF